MSIVANKRKGSCLPYLLIKPLLYLERQWWLCSTVISLNLLNYNIGNGVPSWETEFPSWFFVLQHVVLCSMPFYTASNCQLYVWLKSGSLSYILFACLIDVTTNRKRLATPFHLRMALVLLTIDLASHFVTLIQ